MSVDNSRCESGKMQLIIMDSRANLELLGSPLLSVSAILELNVWQKFALNSPEYRFSSSPASMLCLERLALPSNYLTTLKTWGKRVHLSYS